MHPDEVFWLIEAKRPPKMYGLLTEAEAEECYQEMLANEAAEDAGKGDGDV
jgi:hypothetical protein